MNQQADPVEQQGRVALCAALFDAIATLDSGVEAWLHSPAAWDQRIHPAIRQYLRDIHDHVAALELKRQLSPQVVSAEARRLGRLVNDAGVDAQIDAVIDALLHYQRALQSPP